MSVDTDELECSRQPVDDDEPVTIWYETRGDCRHPGPFDLDERPACEHWFECVWGKITNSAADPRDQDNPVAHLMMTTAGHVEKMLRNGPINRGPLGVQSARICDGRVYFRLEHQGRSWTWELHRARIVNRRTRHVAGTFKPVPADTVWLAQWEAPSLTFSKPISQLLIGRWVD